MKHNIAKAPVTRKEGFYLAKNCKLVGFGLVINMNKENHV